MSATGHPTSTTHQTRPAGPAEPADADPTCNRPTTRHRRGQSRGCGATPPDTAGRGGSRGGRARSKSGRRRVGPRGACPTCGQTKLTRGLELTAPITTLLGLADHPGQLGSWGPVIAETTRALIADLINAPWRISLTDDRGTVIWHGPVRTRPDPDERRRFATAAQAAHVRARDRRCRFPTCRRPATRTELDHSIPHGHDGPTHECNLCCLCVRHHILKTAGLWTPWQQDDGTILWRSALGLTYRTEPEPAEEPT